MKTKINLLGMILIAISLSTSSVYSQNTESIERITFSIETDPSTFAFNGYALHFRIKPSSCKHMLIGAGTYSMDFPSFMIDMNSNNKDKGWKVRINSAFSVFGEYYYKETNKNWFVGMQVGIQNYKITNENVSDLNNKYSNLLLMPSLGFNWQPFKIPLYLKPWFGLGYSSKIRGNNKINNLEYKISPLTPFITLHLGYTF